MSRIKKLKHQRQTEIAFTGSVSGFSKAHTASNVIDGRDIAEINILYPNGKVKKIFYKKCIVITVSQQFMKDHPRAGQPTNFVEQLNNLTQFFLYGSIENYQEFSNTKFHTIREGEYWKSVVEKVNAGTHYLSLRIWRGVPYKSRQAEFMQFNSLGYQEIEIKKNGRINIDGKFFCSWKKDYHKQALLAINDGLSLHDFNMWFKIREPEFKGFKGGIIHFTDLRY